MPVIMGLEGPRPTQMQRVSEQLLGLAPKTMQRAGVQLSGLFDPFVANKAVMFLGLIVGAWLGGTSTGRALVKRYSPFKPK